MLADWAAIAIANSRLYRDVRQRHDELQRANRGLETTTEIGRALGGVTDWTACSSWWSSARAR